MRLFRLIKSIIRLYVYRIRKLRRSKSMDIEYGDFLCIDNELGKRLGKDIDFISYLKWLSTDNFKQLEDELKKNFDLKSIKDQSFDDVIEGILAKTNTDYSRKLKDKNYYACHATAILYVVRHIFSPEVIEVLEESAKRTNDVMAMYVVRNYQGILRDIQMDMMDITNAYGTNISGNKKYKSFIGNRFLTPNDMHQVLRQMLYGTASYHSFADHNPSAAISEIRGLIEIRIRHAFGVLTFVDTQNKNAVVPLGMSKLFEIIDKHKNEIDFPLKLENIERIYHWANTFVHSGLGDYCWVPFYVEFALRNLTFGHETETGFDINNGIAMKQSTIDAIQNELVKMMNSNGGKRYQLWKTKPKCSIKQ